MSAQSITKKELRKIATLSRINLTDKELTKFGDQLSAVIDHVKEIDEVDTSDSSRLSPETSNIFRKDKPEPSLTQEEALSNSTSQPQDGYFTIKSVLDQQP